MKLKSKRLVLFIICISVIAISYYLYKNSFNNKVPRSAKLVRPFKNIEVIPGEDICVKIVELVGESKNSWQEAVENAVKDASKTVRNISGIEVLNNTANVQGGKIVEYKADVAIAFKVDGSSES